METGELIRMYRTRRGMTQQELAEKVGYKHKTAISKIEMGEVAIVRQQKTIEDGEIGIALINGNEGTCKRVKHAADGIVLISLNPAYAPMYYNKHDVLTLPVKIVGKVVETRRRFEKYKS